MPDRIQLQRTKGWRKPEGAIVVARPGKLGNPYRIKDYAPYYEADSLHRLAVSDFRGLVEGRWDQLPDTPSYPSVDEIRAELRGHDLACWCPPDQPCHADVLLEIANA